MISDVFSSWQMLLHIKTVFNCQLLDWFHLDTSAAGQEAWDGPEVLDLTQLHWLGYGYGHGYGLSFPGVQCLSYYSDYDAWKSP